MAELIVLETSELFVNPPLPIVSVLTPPIVAPAVSSVVKVRLLMEKSAPNCVLRLPAPNKLKNTSSAAPGRPGVPLLKSGEDDQFVPLAPPVVFQKTSWSPLQ